MFPNQNFFVYIEYMRIKRSHLESLHFVVGTFLSCFLVVSISSNLQAHPLIQMMEPKASLDALTNDLNAAQPTSCNRHPASELEDVSNVEPEIAAALAAYTSPLTENVEDVMDDACARDSSNRPEPVDSESLNALLTTIESALNVRPAPKTCEDLDPVFDVPLTFETQAIASR